VDSPAQYLHFGFILISLANLLVIALMIVVFILAVALRGPEKQRLSTIEAAPKSEDADDRELKDAYIQALSKATASQGQVIVPQGNYGPLPIMMDQLLTMGSSGALDGLLLRSKGFYQNDFTKPLLFLSEDALPTKAAQLNLLGTQWGMMNETGNYPGAAWLWLYTFWYQIPPYNTSSSADALVLVTMGILTALLVFFPYLPYLNRLPYYLGVHRLIWREYYRDVRAEHRIEGASPGPAT
jgi:hypothetical protein